MDKVKIIFACGKWIVALDNIYLSVVKMGIETGRELVDYCNNHKLKIMNKENLTDYYKKQLKY